MKNAVSSYFLLLSILLSSAKALPTSINSGRSLKGFGGDGFGLSLRIESNANAFSAKTEVTPSYLANLITRKFGYRDGGFVAAIAYAASWNAEDWIRIAKGDLGDDLVNHLAAPSRALAYTEADLYRGPARMAPSCLGLYLCDLGGSGISGDAYAIARGNLIAFSKAYVHLVEEVDLRARSEVVGSAVSKETIELRKLVRHFLEEFQTESRVYGRANAEIGGISMAEQEAEAEAFSHRGRSCAQVWTRGQVWMEDYLNEKDVLVRGLRFKSFKC